jgi:hypothetical protein
MGRLPRSSNQPGHWADVFTARIVDDDNEHFEVGAVRLGVVRRNRDSEAADIGLAILDRIRAVHL